MRESHQFLAVLTGAAIGGILAAMATRDVLAVFVALLGGVFVYVVVGAVLEVAGEPLWDRMSPSRDRDTPGRDSYIRVLILTVMAAALGVSYVFLGAWLAVVAVGLLVAAFVLGALGLMAGE